MLWPLQSGLMHVIEHRWLSCQHYNTTSSWAVLRPLTGRHNPLTNNETVTVIIHYNIPVAVIPAGSPLRGGDVTVCVWHKPTQLATPFYSVLVSVYGPFNRISFRKFSLQLCAFWLCCSSLNTALLFLSTICLFMKVSSSLDIIPSGWLGSKHQLTDWPTN